MSVSLSIHRVTRITLDDVDHDGRKWADFTFHCEDGPGVSFPAFPADPHGELRVEQPRPEWTCEQIDAACDAFITVITPGITGGPDDPSLRQAIRAALEAVR